MNANATTIVAAVVDTLERGWNAASGAAFAEPFAEDADFVTVRGDRHKGRAAIAAGHDGIFATIYRGSRIAYEVTTARHVADDVLLAHAQATLTVPAGPLAGDHVALACVVLVRDAGQWQIAAFHNTLVVPHGPPRPAAGAGAQA